MATSAIEFFGLDVLTSQEARNEGIRQIEKRFPGAPVELEDVQTLAGKEPKDVQAYLADLAAKQERRNASTSHRGVDSQSLDQTQYYNPITEIGGIMSGWTPDLSNFVQKSQFAQHNDDWRLWGASGVAQDDSVFAGTPFNVEEYQKYQREHPDAPMSPFEFALGRHWPDDPAEQDKLWANVSADAKKVYESTGAEWPTEAPSVTAQKQAQAGATGGGGGASGTGKPSTGVPGASGGGAGFDALRNQLASILIQALLQKPPTFPGGVGVGANPGFAQALQQAISGMTAGSGALSQAKDAAANLATFQMPGLTGGFNRAENTADELARYTGPGLTSGFGAAEANAAEIARTGGAPDITNALAAIRAQGLQDIDRFRADERERFAAMGLSAGSDVAEAVGRGASQGVSDLLARQESLIANVLSAANQNRLSAIGMQGQLSALPASISATAAGIRQGGASLAGQLSTLPGQQAAQQAQLRGAGASLLTGTVGLERESALQGAGITANVAAQLQGIAERNREREMQDFLRMTRPNLLTEALSFGVGFPPQPPVVQGGGGSVWPSIIGAVGSVLPFLLASSRTLKDEPELLDTEEVAESLRSLPMYRWNYKGDKTKHIGPMAEEFSEAFGIGDGKTLNTMDMINVMLATQKHILEKHVGKGRTEGARRAKNS